MEKKRLTLSELKVLSESMPTLSEDLQRSFIGGGNGSESSPYSYEEYHSLLSSGNFEGGYVLLNDGDSSSTYIHFTGDPIIYGYRRADGTYVRGGDGTEQKPYPEEEFLFLISSGEFKSGYVLFNGYKAPESIVCGSSGIESMRYDPNKLLLTGVDDWDRLKIGGYAAGYEAGRTEGEWDDFLVKLGVVVNTLFLGEERGGSFDYGMSHYRDGLFAGLSKGKKHKEIIEGIIKKKKP